MALFHFVSRTKHTQLFRYPHTTCRRCRTSLGDQVFFRPFAGDKHHQMNLCLRGNRTQEVSTNSNKRRSSCEAVEPNPDVMTSIWRRYDYFHGVIDLEKPAISGDVEGVDCSGLGKLANQNGKSQNSSCCTSSPENSSLAESPQLCRDWNTARVSAVGSSDTPDCQSPIKTSSIESRHLLFDLNVPQEESLLMSPTLFPSSSTYSENISDNPREASAHCCLSSFGYMKGSSITVIIPNSVADSSRDVVTESSVQKFLFDLNVSLESSDMPSEISNCGDNVVYNDVSKVTAPNNSFSMKNSMHAEASTKYLVRGNDHMLAHEDDSHVLRTAPATNGMNEVLLPESGTINKEILIPGPPVVDNNVPPRLGISHNGASNIQELSMFQDKVSDDDTTVDIAARTLLSIFQHNSECTAHYFGTSNQTTDQDGNDEPQPSLDSFEKTVLNLQEIKDDGQSIIVTPTYEEGPACRIKLKRGRGMRNFQREIIPGLVSLARQEICEDLKFIGYEPRKTRSWKAFKVPGVSSTRPRPC